MWRRLVLTAVALLVLYVSPSTGKVASARRVSNVRIGRLEPPPPPAASRASTVETLNFDQPLDHFNASNNATWTQRLFRNSEFYQPGGPVMLFISGEGELSSGWVSGGNMVAIAAQLGGLCIAIEHRFYGQSRPLPDLSTESLQYLSAQQALADIANFVRQYKLNFPEVADVPWVAFGGSYAGNLASWVRQSYPDLIAAAVASSAPVHANVTFPEYFEVVGDVVGESDPDCLQDIQAASQEFDELVETQAGADNVSDYYSLCTNLDITRPLDVATVEDQIEGLFSNVVQSGSTTVLADVRKRCVMVQNQTGTPLQQMAKTSLQNAGVVPGSGCLNAKFSALVNAQKNTQYTSGDGRQWTWQTCTEFGYFFTMDSPNQPFGTLLTAQFTEETCKGAFGDEYDLARTQRGVDATNAQFGGRNPDVTNVVFVNGGYDPWHRLSVLQNLSDTTVAVFIPDGSHCTDSLSDADGDSAALRSGRAQIRQYVAGFVQSQQSNQVRRRGSRRAPASRHRRRHRH